MTNDEVAKPKPTLLVPDDVVFIKRRHTPEREEEVTLRNKALEQDFNEGKVECDFTQNKRNLMAIWDHEARTWRYMDAYLLWKAVALAHDPMTFKDANEIVKRLDHREDSDNWEKLHGHMQDCWAEIGKLKEEVKSLATQLTKPKAAATRGGKK